MLIGYARTSTVEQIAGLEAQERDLQAAGVEKLYKEYESAMNERPQLQILLDFIREGDTLVITKLDRLARSVSDLCSIVAKLEKKGVALRILGMGIDTNTPTGKLMLNIFGSIAQFERELMLERQAEGIAKAKAEGKYKGRAPTAIAKTDQVILMNTQGFTKAHIAKQLGIGVASVYRILGNQMANDHMNGIEPEQPEGVLQ